MRGLTNTLQKYRINNGDYYYCPHCNKICNKYYIGKHILWEHTDNGKQLKKECYNKLSNIHKGKCTYIPTDETKQKISQSMKKAHAEGRANNWQDSKKYNNKSYPEVFFEKIIKNEFYDKNYIYGYRIGKYCLDFAWPYKKIYIEIDGKQHLDNLKYDANRDLYMKNLGWVGLRIFWQDLYHDTQTYINIANKFVNNKSIKNIDNIDFDINLHIYKSTKKYLNTEQLIKKQNNIKAGKITKNGIVHSKVLSIIEIENRKQQILNSGVDLSKFGWVGKVEKITGLTRRQIYKIVNKTDLKNSVFRRN